MATTIGRRVTNADELELPGDYWRGEVQVHVDGTTADTVLCLLPTTDGVPEWAHGIHQVRQPPHVFRECPDGSLEIRESIGCGGAPGGGFYWHGYLDEGNAWREC